MEECSYAMLPSVLKAISCCQVRHGIQRLDERRTTCAALVHATHTGMRLWQHGTASTPSCLHACQDMELPYKRCSRVLQLVSACRWQPVLGSALQLRLWMILAQDVTTVHTLGYSVPYFVALFGFWALTILSLSPKSTYFLPVVTELPSI